MDSTPTYSLFDVTAFDPNTGKIVFDRRITSINRQAARDETVARLAKKGKFSHKLAININPL